MIEREGIGQGRELDEKHMTMPVNGAKKEGK
jgi:hypothetical protein